MITCKGKFVKRIEKVLQDGKTKLSVLTVLAPDETKIYYLTDYDYYGKICEIGTYYEFEIRFYGSKTGYANLILSETPRAYKHV